MFSQVYFHRVRRAYDHHLTLALRGILPGGKYPGLDELDDYLGWDDQKVYGALRSIAGQNSAEGKHAERILLRDHYRVAYSTNEHPTSGQLARWKGLEDRVKDRFADAVTFDGATKAPHRFGRSLQGFPVIKEPGAPPTFIEEESALIDRLEELRVMRVLTPSELVSEVKSFCEELNYNVR